MKLLLTTLLFPLLSLCQTKTTITALRSNGAATTKTIYYTVSGKDTTYWKTSVGNYPLSDNVIPGKKGRVFVRMTLTESPAVLTYTNDVQFYTARCPERKEGVYIAYTARIPAGAYTSTISKADADNKALAAALREANAGLKCVDKNDDGYLLIMDMGESNFVTRAQPVEADFVTAPTGSYWYKQATNELVQIGPRIGEGDHGGYGMAAAFSKRLYELTGKKVIIVHKPRGATTIGAWSKGVGIYEDALNTWNAALSYCATNNIKISGKYCFFLQGGNDYTLEETDGYYVQLMKWVDNVRADFGVEKIFDLTTGYDINVDSLEAEKIIRAHLIASLNHPHLINVSNSSRTFTTGAGTMLWDGLHYALKGCNIIGSDMGEGLAYYLQTGGKISLYEPIARLRNVSGEIDLSPNWRFEFNESLKDENNHATVRRLTRDGKTAANYSNGSLVLSGNGGLYFSRPVELQTFTIETRFRFTKPSGSSPLLTGTGRNQITIEHEGYNSKNNYLALNLGGIGAVFFLPTGTDLSQFHTLRVVQNREAYQVFWDDKFLSTQAGSNPVSFQWVGFNPNSGPSTNDIQAEIDYIHINN